MPLKTIVAWAGIKPATQRFSVLRSYQLSYQAKQSSDIGLKQVRHQNFATRTGLEPAASAVTGRRANQLRYRALSDCI